MFELAHATGAAWARGMAERTAALLADDSAAESHFLASIALLDLPGHVGDLSRSRLLYGEWLRRMRRRRDAREQLVLAASGFEEVGATVFAERARRELVAAGAGASEGMGDGGASTRRAAPDGELSAQERQVATLAAAGATNADIAAAMFISPNTVDYHLRKVFRKLAITSRRQLSERLSHVARPAPDA